MIFGIMLGVYTLLFAGLAAVVCHKEYGKYYIAAKGVNSLAFVTVFFLASYISCDIRQFWLMLPAFVCCFAGDIFMGCYNRFQRKAHFVMGLGSFLAGHICFVRWMCRLWRIEWADFIFPLLAVLIAYGITASKKMHTGRLRPVILVYTFFVGMLFSRGMLLAWHQPTAQHLITAAGGTLFLLSDLSILFLYFTGEKRTGVHLFNLATYYYGIFLLASALLF